jgi:hypothetical protein
MDASIDRSRRASVILYALVERGGEEPVDCRVRNLSIRGACIDDNLCFVVGECVTLTMGALPPFTATVVWAEHDYAGLSFPREVDLAAARQPRGRVLPTVKAGWTASMDDPYRRRT